MSIPSALIYFIACHGGPAAHFSEFANELRRDGYQIEILATGPALDKLRSLGAKEFNPDQLDINNPINQRILAEKVACSLGSGAAVITDVGHLLMANVQEAIALRSPTIKRIAYYDNPEPFVPGGYSETAEKVMSCAQKVLFSNANLAKTPLYASPDKLISLPFENRIGLGYYPVKAAAFLEAAREARHDIARRTFFQEHQISDKGQKILVYLGGNNDVYFEKAFPAFLHLLKESNLSSSEYIVLMQHHPGDKKREIDVNLSGGYPIYISNTNSEEALILADAALYYQTSMGSQLVLAGIPAIQVGHDRYNDILVRNSLAATATTAEEFLHAVKACNKPMKNAKLLNDLGISKDWLIRLKSAID